MKHKFDVINILQAHIGYKGLPFPGAFTMPKGNEFINRGTRLYKKDYMGRWYFMPVTFIVEGAEVEFPTAVLNVTGKKTIVEAPMVGDKGGSIKELVNVDDFRVSITGYIQSTDGSYPEEGIVEMVNLYKHNKAVGLISGLTDLIFDEGDQVVINSVSFPPTPGLEDGQVVKVECTTDKPFKLIIE